MGAGAALYNYYGYAAVTQCLFVSNAVYGGLGGAGNGPSAFNGSAGSGFGAAVFNYDGELFVTNTAFSNNLANFGDDLFNLSDSSETPADLTLSGVTMQSSTAHTNLVSEAIDGGLTTQALFGLDQISSQAPPWIASIANVTVATSFTVPLSVSPPSLGGAYSIMATSDNPAIVAETNLIVTNGVLIVTPTAGQIGSDLITVTVTDTGISASASFLLTVGVSAPTITVAAVLTNGQFHVHFTGAPDTTYVIQASTDLKNWLVMGIATQGISGVYDYIDTNSSSYRDRFYRVAQVVIAQATLLNAAFQTNGTFRIQFTGAGTSYSIFVSTNLLQWTQLGSAVSIGSDQFQFIDTTKTGARFYRIRSP